MTTVSPDSISIPRIRADLAGRVIGPQDPGYDNARKVFLGLADRRPAAIVRPADAAEVAHVVELARESGLELAVRSGGHSVAGHGVSEGGIVLDLSLLKRLETDPDARVAWAETGLTAGEVTSALGGARPGGRLRRRRAGRDRRAHPRRGVGYLARKHGLTIDHPLAAEIVTADGHTLRVDSEQHPDLFWAIRGGGGNFGVATRFQYRLHPLETVTGGMLVLPATPEVVSGFVAAAEAPPEELSTIANVMPAPQLPFVPEEHHGKLVVLAMLVHAGPAEAGEQAVAPFRSLATPIADHLRPLPYADMYPPDEGATVRSRRVARCSSTRSTTRWPGRCSSGSEPPRRRCRRHSSACSAAPSPESRPTPPRMRTGRAGSWSTSPPSSRPPKRRPSTKPG
ncbi:MAG TPA: FAD-binding oxidoreductase [Gaiellaceae bacterium]|nr:FAD-binding oxidoreductase [Gaiellaceae bacterium]